MHETVLISLAAVVALIVIVILLGMRYLRADDEDDFDDVSTDHVRSRSRGSLRPHEQARPRRQHDDMPDERLRQGAVPAGAGRSVRGSDARSGAGRGPADLPAYDRGWREDSGSRRARTELPQRDARPARQASRHDDISEPAAASARRGFADAGRGGHRGIDDFEARPDRMPVAPRDYDRDLADGRDGRDRREVRDDREFRDRRDGRDNLDSREFRDRRDARSVVGMRESAGADGPDRRATTRPGPRQDGRKNGAVGERDELPAIKPRQGRGKRDEDGDWPSNEWDELSDVDYWAELASDKPLTTTPPVEQPGRSGRGESRSDTVQAAARGDRDAGQGGRLPRQPDPARKAGQALVPAVARKADLAPTDWREDLGGGGSRRGAQGRTEQLHAVPASTGPGWDSRASAPADDDPLTSPSFPRISADDSRSYRRGGRAASDESQPMGRVTDGASFELPQAAGHGQTGEQSIPALPRVEPVRGLDGSSQPRGYSRSAGAGADYPRPGADPYGSVPAGGSVPSYQVPAVASVGGYPDGTVAYSTPASQVPASAGPAGSGGYPIPGGSLPGGYQGNGGYPEPAGTGQNGYPGAGGPASASYLPPAATGSGGYGGETVVRGSYQPAAQDPLGFPAQAADLGYPTSLPASGGYPDAGPGGHAAATGSYSFGSDTADYRSGRADLSGGYPAYPESGPASGSHARPDPAYLPGGYTVGHEPDGNGPLPAGQPDAGYSVYPAPVPLDQVYPAPVPLDQGGPYPEPSGQQLPAGSAGYQEPPYQPGPYDQAGYQVPAPQPGYAGADPYAVDPYGHEYGSGGNGSGGY